MLNFIIDLLERLTTSKGFAQWQQARRKYKA